jgi:hypothetical protein
MKQLELQPIERSLESFRILTDGLTVLRYMRIGHILSNLYTSAANRKVPVENIATHCVDMEVMGLRLRPPFCFWRIEEATDFKKSRASGAHPMLRTSQVQFQTWARVSYPCCRVARCILRNLLCRILSAPSWIAIVWPHVKPQRTRDIRFLEPCRYGGICHLK